MKILNILTIKLAVISFVIMFLIYILFSFNDLFIYYILQPYTSDYGQKSPMFSVVNMVIYILAYTCLNIKLDPKDFMITLIIATIIYTSVGYILLNQNK